jgi:hypothetical protein
LDKVSSVFRDHYEGTEFDLTQGMAAGPYGNPNRAKTPLGMKGQWERAISMHRTSWSFILMARPNGRSVAWFGWDAPHGTAYLPFYGAATSGAPSSYSGLHAGAHHMGKFSTDVAFWAFNLVNQYEDLNYALINKDVRQKAAGIEAQAQRSLEAWEQEADMLQSDKAAIDLLTSRTNAFAAQTVADWWSFAWSLIAKYRGYVITTNETATGVNAAGQQYPVWWLESPEVGFTNWKSDGPFHGILLGALPTNLSAQLSFSGDYSTMLMLLVMAFPISLAIIALKTYNAGLRQGRAELSVHGYYAQTV